MLTGKEVSWILTSYCLGCFASGYYWVRFRTGLDIRHQGSGTVGARNAGRVLGATGFLVTFVLDFAKGALAVAAAKYFQLSGPAIVASILAVVLGHTFPIQLRCQGGKGIATSLGALLAYDLAFDTSMVAVLVGVFLPALALLRSFTLSGLVAFALAPLVVFLWGMGNEATAAVSFLAILVLLSHRRNIREEFARIFPGRAVKHGAVHKHEETDS
jgi:acyl phosphate:glycerol-3-phosphate acyltransferase